MTINNTLKDELLSANKNNKILRSRNLTLAYHFVDEKPVEKDGKTTNCSHAKRNVTLAKVIGLGELKYRSTEATAKWPTYLTSTGLVVTIDETTNEVLSVINYSYKDITKKFSTVEKQQLKNLKARIDAAHSFDYEA